MSFNKDEHYGISLGEGSPTNGFRVQNGKTYDHQGREVDAQGKPVKGVKAPTPAPKPEAKTEAEKQVQEQGNV